MLPYALFVGEQAKLPEILEDPSVYITKPDGSRARSLTAIARHLSAKWKASEQLQQVSRSAPCSRASDVSWTLTLLPRRRTVLQGESSGGAS